VAFEAVGWPALSVIAISLPSGFEVERALVIALTLGLLVRERWRAAEERRDQADLDRFLRALEDDDALAPTVEAGAVVAPLGGEARAVSPPSPYAPSPPSPISSRAIASVHERRTAVQHPSDRPTIPDSERSMHVVRLASGPRGR
jgi:hypothetical protein